MKKRILLILLAGVMLMAMLAMSLTSCLQEKDPEPEPEPEQEIIQETITIPGVTPDYPTPPVDEEAEDSVDSDEKMEVPEGSTGVGMEYKTEVIVDLSDKAVSLYFRNPSRSLQNMSLELMVEDQLVARSGLIVPGKQLLTMTLLDGVTLVASDVVKDGKFVVRYYDPETNECSIVTSEIMVQIGIIE